MDVAVDDAPGLPVVLPERFWKKIQVVQDCWIWQGATTGGRYPYGQVTWNGRRCVAHRVSYEATGREIPEGLTLDHLCRTRLCVRPSHLEPVTRTENIRRSDAPNMRAARLNQCYFGHELTPDNTVLHGTQRRCAKCVRRRARQSTERARQRREAERNREI